MDAKNQFFKGIDKDLGLDKLPPQQYYDALNMRIITDEGGTSGNIQNTKGNIALTQFLDVPAIYAVTAQSNFNANETSNFDININGVTTTLTGVTETFTALTEAINNDTNLSVIGVRAYTNEESIFNDTPTMYITLSGGVLNFVTIVSATCNLVVSPYAPNVSGVRIIGWVMMREDIILLTSDSSSANPTNTLGQIWRFVYNKDSLSINLELLYNNYLNLSSANPIANPGMIEARYETPTLQNIYWTDNYNNPRVANVADPNLFSIDPRFFSINPVVSPFIPLPQRINQSGGGLKTGIHYLAYRLSNSQGGETSWFPPSYGLRIIERNEESSSIVEWEWTGSNYTRTDNGYSGSPSVASGKPEWDIDLGRDTSKSITFAINGIDTNYSRIEYAHIYKSGIDNVEINIVANEAVSSSTSIYTLTGIENDRVPISMEEFLSSGSNIQRVGTLTAKDNYLFLANIKTETLDLNWDARAYRFDSGGTCNVSDQYGNLTSVSPVNWTLSSEHDAINPNDDPDSDNNYLYQSDGTTFGGEGPNIKYSFVTRQIILDSRITESNGTSMIPPLRYVDKGSLSFTDINSQSPVNQSFLTPDTLMSFHSPYIEGFLKGYMRDEVYRFGIVFYDLSHRPMFVKWIADIRMPHMYMPNGPTAADRTLQYPLTNDSASYAASEVLSGNVLGIEFTVSNLDTISEFISGYQIVRLPRKDYNKSIVGQSMLQFAHGDSFSGITVIPPATGSFSYAVGGFMNISGTIASMAIPEILFPGMSNYQYSTGDAVDIIGIYDEDVVEVLPESGGGSVGGIIKTYTHVNGVIPESISTGNTPYAIDSSLVKYPWFSGGWGKFTMGTTQNIQNNGGIDTSWTGTYDSAGNKVLVLEGQFADFDSTGSNFTQAAIDNTVNTRKIYVANYKRDFTTGAISTQYGSNTYSQRSRGEYISTNHYQPTTITSTSYTSSIFGGDTLVCIHDYYQYFWDKTSADFAAGATHMLARFYPVETTVNIEMRQGDGPSIEIPNKTILLNTAPFHLEDMLVNKIFSHENDVLKYFPKPVPYLPQTEFDCRIHNSAYPKINGELTDVWRIFKPEDYIEVDSKYGPINIIFPQNNRLYYVQDTAVGIYQTNEKSMLQDVQGGQIIIGSGGLKQRVDYLSEKIGSKHKFSFTHSKFGTIFFDSVNKRAYILADQLSELQGLSGYFQKEIYGPILTNDNPYLGLGITSTYSYKFDEFYMTFLNVEEGNVRKDFTVSFNPIIKAFTSFHSFTPKTYINDKYNIITPDSPGRDELLYIHDIGNYGEFYGTVYPSNVTLVMNAHPDHEKIFDNLLINSKTYLNGVDVPAGFFDTFEVWNDHQNTGLKPFTTNGRFILRKWNAAIGGDAGNSTRTERIKSNYAFAKFETDNTNNYYIVLEGVIYKYRINPTMF